MEWSQFGGALPARTLTLQPGWVLMLWIGAEAVFTEAVGKLSGIAPAVFRWDGELGAYDAFYSAGPAITNTLTALHPPDGLWVIVAAGLAQLALTSWIVSARRPVAARAPR